MTADIVFSDLRQILHGFVAAVVVDVVGGRLGAQKNVIADILFDETVSVMTADHGIGQVHILDYRLQLPAILFGDLPSEGRAGSVRSAELDRSSGSGIGCYPCGARKRRHGNLPCGQIPGAYSRERPARVCRREPPPEVFATLLVWRKAHEFVLAVYAFTTHFHGRKPMVWQRNCGGRQSPFWPISPRAFADGERWTRPVS